AEVLAPCEADYERARSGVVLAPVRSPPDWAMAAVRRDGLTLYRLDDGYAVAQARDGLGTVAELVAPTGGRTGALLGAIAADWRDAGASRCDIAIPGREEDLDAVRAFAPAAEWTPDATGMTRPLRRTPRITGIRHFGAADYF
ncbi:MAG: GNAT family N-acetyltransferase, partial [Microbacterium sp.]|nr:GNAT family N-acetyltransferase [Microbacterium sp.]